MPKLIGIATHSTSKGEIKTHDDIKVSVEKGLKDDYQGQKNSHTAVTLLSLKSWLQACKECDCEIDWTQRRANLLIDDIEFNAEMIGQQIQIGEVLLEITKETDPCNRMEALQKGLKDALTQNWRGGARCRVLRKGRIKYGDSLTLLKRF